LHAFCFRLSIAPVFIFALSAVSPLVPPGLDVARDPTVRFSENQANNSSSEPTALVPTKNFDYYKNVPSRRPQQPQPQQPQHYNQQPQQAYPQQQQQQQQPQQQLPYGDQYLGVVNEVRGGSSLSSHQRLPPPPPPPHRSILPSTSVQISCLHPLQTCNCALFFSDSLFSLFPCRPPILGQLSNHKHSALVIGRRRRWRRPRRRRRSIRLPPEDLTRTGATTEPWTRPQDHRNKKEEQQRQMTPP
jgi:hypothetical protein